MVFWTPPRAPVDEPWEPHWEDEEEWTRVDESVSVEPRVVGPSSFEVTGYVLGSGLEPQPGVTVALNEEIAETDGHGRFAFPAAQRDGVGVIECRRGDTVITRWEDVVLGPKAIELGVVASDILPQPFERLRLTINLAPQHVPEPTDTDQPASPISIVANSVLVEDWGRGGRVRCSGTTNLPDGASLVASLYFDDVRSFASIDAVKASEGRFVAAIWSTGIVPFYSGRYLLEISFNRNMESPTDIGTWLESHADLELDRVFDRNVRAEVFIGDREEALEEDRQLETYFSERLSTARQLYTVLKTQVQSVELLSRGWSPHLVAAQRQAQVSWFGSKMVNEDGSLNEVAWRDFLDQRWRPQIVELLAAHKERGSGKYREAEAHLVGLYEDLHLQSLSFSKFIVYPRFGLPPHPADEYLDEFGDGDLQLAERRIRNRFAALERYCHLTDRW